MGLDLEWEPWNSDLWNTPQDPDDDEAYLDLIRERLREAEEGPWQERQRERRLAASGRLKQKTEVRLMGWEKLDIHVENLLPGLATAWAISLHWQPPAMSADATKVPWGIALIGAAYMLGVVVNVACRLALDFASERITRQLVFRVFAEEKLRDMKGATRKQINDAYNYYCDRAIAEGKEISKEVAKRRQTGRLLRSSLVPIILIQLAISGAHGFSLGVTLVLVFAECAALLMLYGYAEVIILQEAHFAVPHGERSVTEIAKLRVTAPDAE